MGKSLIFNLLSILVISAFLTSCGSSNNGEETDVEDTKSTNTSAQQLVDEPDNQNSRDSANDNGGLVTNTDDRNMNQLKGQCCSREGSMFL